LLLLISVLSSCSRVERGFSDRHGSGDRRGLLTQQVYMYSTKYTLVPGSEATLGVIAHKDESSLATYELIQGLTSADQFRIVEFDEKKQTEYKAPVYRWFPP